MDNLCRGAKAGSKWNFLALQLAADTGLLPAAAGSAQRSHLRRRSVSWISLQPVHPAQPRAAGTELQPASDRERWDPRYRRLAQLRTAQTTSLSSRGPLCHLPDPLPANRPRTGLTPVCSELCARSPAPRMAPALPCSPQCCVLTAQLRESRGKASSCSVASLSTTITSMAR